MLVYGDLRRWEDPRAKAAAMRQGLERWRTTPLPIERHALLAELLVEAGELEQGLLDARVEPWVAAAAQGLTRAAAVLLLASFHARGELTGGAEAAALESALDGLTLHAQPESIEVSTPEGYAFYGLYPETCFRAAEAARQDGDSPWRVIGIRSIGTGLAAAVAAVLAPGVRVASVRPTGHPFARRLEAEDSLLAGQAPCRYAVVDEGPGLSGSSFGCVADWLEDHGVAPEAISFFPSHRGLPGPYASPRHLERWQRARRYVAEFEEVFTSPEAPWPLTSWVADLTGEADRPLRDLSAGRWREVVCPDAARWPAADLQGERRKYLLTAGGRPWLLKFAGLGRHGREKLALAGELEGLIPPLLGLRHGFLVGPWLADARPLPLAPEIPRPHLLQAVAAYLARRVLRLPADPRRRGATPAQLFEMACFNVGADESWRSHLPAIAARERPILTDNRMHAWEWLVTPDGRILKSDALDHHRGNDLIGPQDVAWDLAGAAVELDLDDDELDRLAFEVARQSGTPRAARWQLDFYALAYRAFQIGRLTLTAQALDAGAPAEAARTRAAMKRYSSQWARNPAIASSVSP